jgi:hypothetical protein
MQSRITSALRSSARKALLPALAAAALVTGLSTSQAWDQQATSAQMDYELSQRAATNGFGSEGRYYAQAPAYEGRNEHAPYDEDRSVSRRHHDER